MCTDFTLGDMGRYLQVDAPEIAAHGIQDDLLAVLHPPARNHAEQPERVARLQVQHLPCLHQEVALLVRLMGADFEIMLPERAGLMVEVGRDRVVVRVQEGLDLAEPGLDDVVLAIIRLAEERVPLADDIAVVLQDERAFPALWIDDLREKEVDRTEQPVRRHDRPVGTVVLRCLEQETRRLGFGPRRARRAPGSVRNGDDR